MSVDGRAILHESKKYAGVFHSPLRLRSRISEASTAAITQENYSCLNLSESMCDMSLIAHVRRVISILNMPLFILFHVR